MVKNIAVFNNFLLSGEIVLKSVYYCANQKPYINVKTEEESKIF